MPMGDSPRIDRTLAIFLVTVAVGITGLVLLWQAGSLRFIANLTALTVAKVATLAGLKATARADLIYVSSQTWLVTLECTAAYLIAVYSAFVLAYPAGAAGKIIGLVAGVSAIILANIGRLVLLAFMVKYLPTYFQTAHDYVWQVAFLIFVAALWLVWIEAVVGRARISPCNPQSP